VRLFYQKSIYLTIYPRMPPPPEPARPEAHIGAAVAYSPTTHPTTMPPDRLSLRLGQLPHDVLAELAARLCSDSPALQAAAEECMAAHTPLPHWAVDRVLISADLVPHLLGPLEAEDGAAAAVCTQWLAGWKATNEPRRQLKPVPLDFPEELVTDDMKMAGTPDGRLVVSTRLKVHILDRSMRVLQTVAGEYGHGSIAASDDFSIFPCPRASSLCRSTYDGTTVAEYRLKGYLFAYPVLAPGGLLFCVIYERGDAIIGVEDRDEIIALDAQTLQLRHRFGLGLLNGARGLAVGGDELYVCEIGNHRLQVFSLTGEHRRSITGEWRSPESLCFAKDRLYLVERDPEMEDHEEDEDGESVAPAFPLQGRRILVLSLQGDILQVVTHPTEPTAKFQSICCFDCASCWRDTGTPLLITPATRSLGEGMGCSPCEACRVESEMRQLVNGAGTAPPYVISVVCSYRYCNPQAHSEFTFCVCESSFNVWKKMKTGNPRTLRSLCTAGTPDSRPVVARRHPAGGHAPNRPHGRVHIDLLLRPQAAGEIHF
jgi:hypothetical protein